jgi:hypothetical protein
LVGRNVTRSRLNITDELQTFFIALQKQLKYIHVLQTNNFYVKTYCTCSFVLQLKPKSSMRAEEAKQLIHNVQSLHFQCLRLFERVISLCSYVIIYERSRIV